MNRKEYIVTERIYKFLKTQGIPLVCLVCGEPVVVGDKVKAAYGYRGAHRKKLRHVRCLVSVPVV